MNLCVSVGNAIARFRGSLLGWYLRLCGCRVGRKLKCRQWPTFRTPPNRNIQIGDCVTIGWRIAFDIAETGKLTLGNRVNLTQDIVIASVMEVSLGDGCLVAEFASIRDSDHGMARETFMAGQPMRGETVEVGEDVWLAAGCRILRGARIPRGCVIAANAVVTGRTRCVEHGVYGGVPACFLKERTFGGKA